MERDEVIERGVKDYLDEIVSTMEQSYSLGASEILNMDKVGGNALEAMLYQALLRHRDNRDGTFLYSQDVQAGKPFLSTVKKRLKTIKKGLREETDGMFALIERDPHFLNGFLALVDRDQIAFCGAVLKAELQKYKDNPPKRGWKMEPRVYIDPEHKPSHEEESLFDKDGVFYNVAVVFLWLVAHLGFLGAVAVVALFAGLGIAGVVIFGMVELYNLFTDGDVDSVELLTEIAKKMYSDILSYFSGK